MIEEKLKEMQKSIDLIECYQAIAESNCLLSQAKKEKYKKLEVYDLVEKEIREFCEDKINALVGQPKEDFIIPNPEFTAEEITILKKLCYKLKTKDGQKESITPTTPSNPPPPQMRRISKEKKTVSNNIISDDETRGISDPTIFIGRNTRTLGHRTLEINTNNAPGTYSLVKILDINPTDNKARIEFLSSNEVGVISLSELSGFEYLER